MHNRLSALLQAALGPPSRSMDGCDWWTLPRPVGEPMSVCLNDQPRTGRAHVMLFDPAGLAESVIEIDVQNEADAAQALARIEAMRRRHRLEAGSGGGRLEAWGLEA